MKNQENNVRIKIIGVGGGEAPGRQCRQPIVDVCLSEIRLYLPRWRRMVFKF